MKPGEHQDIAMPFGKHKGEILADLQSSYLRWLREQDFVHHKFPNLAKQLKIELEFRDRFDKHFE